MSFLVQNIKQHSTSFHQIKKTQESTGLCQELTVSGSHLLCNKRILTLGKLIFLVKLDHNCESQKCRISETVPTSRKKYRKSHCQDQSDMEATGFFPHLIFIARNLTKIVPLFRVLRNRVFFNVLCQDEHLDNMSNSVIELHRRDAR